MKQKSIEVKAKTVHEAITDACEQLGVDQDQVNVEILSQGGMFGKAKVLVTIKEEFLKPEAPAPKPTETPKPESKPAPEPKATKPAQPAEKPVTKPTKEEVKPSKQKKADISTAASTHIAGIHENGQPVSTPKFEKCYAFIAKFLELLENDSSITSEFTEKSFNINIAGENIGRLIGKGGEVLNAIQTIVSSIAISNACGEGKRVFVNIGDYKERRGDSLQSLALKKAEYVKNSGKFVKLDPMNARDRAIIHTALSEVEGIRTYSTGKDPFRCLCIAPADKEKKNPNKKEDE